MTTRITTTKAKPKWQKKKLGRGLTVQGLQPKQVTKLTFSRQADSGLERAATSPRQHLPLFLIGNSPSTSCPTHFPTKIQRLSGRRFPCRDLRLVQGWGSALTLSMRSPSCSSGSSWTTIPPGCRWRTSHWRAPSQTISTSLKQSQPVSINLNQSHCKAPSQPGGGVCRHSQQPRLPPWKEAAGCQQRDLLVQEHQGSSKEGTGGKNDKI